MTEPDLTIDTEAEKLVGKTVAAIQVDSSSDRSYELRLRFTDGDEVKIDYFAAYADDAGLCVEWVKPQTDGKDLTDGR